MIVILDGYNIIKKITHTLQVTERERNTFINAIKSYALVKKLQIELVFDGGLSLMSQKEDRDGIKVVYVGTGRSADDYIKDFLSHHKGRNVLLVSADNELRRFADASLIDSLSSDEFIVLLGSFLENRDPQLLNKQPTIRKIRNTPPTELDALMIAGSHMMSEHKDDSLRKPPQSSSKKISKVEKRILQKIKKL